MEEEEEEEEEKDNILKQRLHQVHSFVASQESGSILDPRGHKPQIQADEKGPPQSDVWRSLGFSLRFPPSG